MNSYEKFLRSQRERNRKNHHHPEPIRSYKYSVSYKTHETFAGDLPGSYEDVKEALLSLDSYMPLCLQDFIPSDMAERH